MGGRLKREGIWRRVYAYGWFALLYNKDTNTVLWNSYTPIKIYFKKKGLMNQYRPSVVSMKTLQVPLKEDLISLLFLNNPWDPFPSWYWLGEQKSSHCQTTDLSPLWNKSLNLHGEEQQNCHIRALVETLCSWVRQEINKTRKNWEYTVVRSLY